MIGTAGSNLVSTLLRSPSSGSALLNNLAAGMRLGPNGAAPITLPPVSPDALSGAPTGLVNDPTRPTVALPSFAPDNSQGSLQLLDFSFTAIRDRVDISAEGFGRLVGDYSREQFSVTALQRGKDGTDTLVKMDFLHERLVARFGGAGEEAPGGTKGPGEDASRDPLGAALGNPMSALFAAFAPDKVAGRIADFAQGGYSHFLNGNKDTSDLRGSFRDFISPYITKGYDEALGLLGDSISSDIRDLLAKTKSLVEQRLAAFVDGGSAKTSSEPPALAASMAPTSLVDLTA